MSYTKTIQLTKNVKVNEGSHILYFYESEKQYIENVKSFILAAKHLHQDVIFIDTPAHFKIAKEQLGDDITKLEENGTFRYIDNLDFYEAYGDFHFSKVVNNFKEAVAGYEPKKNTVRVWGLVNWKNQDNIREKLQTYECECDIAIGEIGVLTVCAYNSNNVPAYIQTDMLRSHEYFMTDDDLVLSSLYKQYNETIFPTLSAQTEIETEVDFYKQKLDFIHVVAHEVRNPLTVIKSFASLLKTEIDDPRAHEKLQLIEDYSDAIDHEIHHIIQTEQMISMDSFWEKKRVQVSTILSEAIKIMKTKARTQNISLEYKISIDNDIHVHANFMGLKLIITNLLSNAIKYSSERQIVTILCFEKQGKLIIEVVDQGIGMTKDQLNKLFKKYQKMNEEHTGQGIGLYMVNKLVNHFHGDISVQSTPCKGTTVSISLPIMKEEDEFE
ncbi:MEDS domain-containing protein [Evansella sp. AB-rgal1]|uniref:MEDS domain-containing protein n=1 Tax=Evansella sp. AB-rgal1 TaxID=3242696 RepID=UPI00359E9D64